VALCVSPPLPESDGGHRRPSSGLRSGSCCSACSIPTPTVLIERLKRRWPSRQCPGLLPASSRAQSMDGALVAGPNTPLISRWLPPAELARFLPHADDGGRHASRPSHCAGAGVAGFRPPPPPPRAVVKLCPDVGRPPGSKVESLGARLHDPPTRAPVSAWLCPRAGASSERSASQLTSCILAEPMRYHSPRPARKSPAPLADHHGLPGRLAARAWCGCGVSTGG